MIISISAAPIVDTATAVRALAAKHGYAVCHDPMRERCAEHGFQTIYEMPTALQASVRTDLIRQHLAQVTATSDLLLNYSIFGWLADWMRWFWSSTHTEQWSEIMTQAKSIAERYDVIYHIENNSRADYDGYLWLDQRNSHQVNSLMKYLYSELGVSGKVQGEVG